MLTLFDAYVVLHVAGNVTERTRLGWGRGLTPAAGGPGGGRQGRQGWAAGEVVADLYTGGQCGAWAWGGVACGVGVGRGVWGVGVGVGVGDFIAGADRTNATQDTLMHTYP